MTDNNNNNNQRVFKLYELFDGFTCAADSHTGFAEAMKASARFIPESKTLEEYIEGVAYRLAITEEMFIECTDCDSFVESLQANDLLKISDMN